MSFPHVNRPHLAQYNELCLVSIEVVVNEICSFSFSDFEALYLSYEGRSLKTKCTGMLLL